MTRTAEQRDAITTWRRMQRMLRPKLRLDRGGFPNNKRTPLRDLELRAHQKSAGKELSAYVEWFPKNWKLGSGLTLVGHPGLGKTTLACAAAAELVEYYGYVAAFTTLDRYIRGQQKMMSLGKLIGGADTLAQESREEIGEINHADWVYRKGAYLLVLDDVGREYRTGSGWAAQEFDSLLRERFEMGLPTIITTNMPFDKWSSEYSVSMRSFAAEVCSPVEMDR